MGKTALEGKTTEANGKYERSKTLAKKSSKKAETEKKTPTKSIMTRF